MGTRGVETPHKMNSTVLRLTLNNMGLNCAGPLIGGLFFIKKKKNLKQKNPHDPRLVESTDAEPRIEWLIERIHQSQSHFGWIYPKSICGFWDPQQVLETVHPRH